MQSRMQVFKDRNLVREIISVKRLKASFIFIAGKKVIDFTSNDYLGIARSDRIKKVFTEGVSLYGFGSGSSALVSGYSYHHQKLEEKFAEFLNFEKAILFNSGYHANIGLITAIANKDDNIVFDKLCHASIIDGVKLSGAKWRRYSHNNFVKLYYIISKLKKSYLISEGVFSTQGDITKLDKLCEISKNYNAKLIIDDAHGAGILGKNGRGILEYYNLNYSDIFCQIVPLGKSFGGLGAIVAGSMELIDYLRQFSRSYIYSTALPAALVYTLLQSLEIVKNENFRRERLNELIFYFINESNRLGLKLLSYDITPIKCIIIRCNKKLQEIQQKLLDKGFFISIIRSPTVPYSLSRIKIILSYLHEETHITSLLELIAKELEC